MRSVETLLVNVRENLKMELWWAEEHDKEGEYINDIPKLKQQIDEIDEALLKLFG